MLNNTIPKLDWDFFSFLGVNRYSPDTNIHGRIRSNGSNAPLPSVRGKGVGKVDLFIYSWTVYSGRMHEFKASSISVHDFWI